MNLNLYNQIETNIISYIKSSYLCIFTHNKIPFKYFIITWDF